MAFVTQNPEHPRFNFQLQLNLKLQQPLTTALNNIAIRDLIETCDLQRSWMSNTIRWKTSRDRMRESLFCNICSAASAEQFQSCTVSLRVTTDVS